MLVVIEKQKETNNIGWTIVSIRYEDDSYIGKKEPNISKFDNVTETYYRIDSMVRSAKLVLLSYMSLPLSSNHKRI